MKLKNYIFRNPQWLGGCIGSILSIPLLMIAAADCSGHGTHCHMARVFFPLIIILDGMIEKFFGDSFFLYLLMGFIQCAVYGVLIGRIVALKKVDRLIFLVAFLHLTSLFTVFIFKIV